MRTKEKEIKGEYVTSHTKLTHTPVNPILFGFQNITLHQLIAVEYEFIKNINI